MSASKYYLLKNTLSDIEKMTEEIIAIDEQIPKKQVDINRIEAKLKNASDDYQNKKEKLEDLENNSLDRVDADIESLKSSLKNAKKLEKNYSRENFSGMSVDKFREEKLDGKLRVPKPSWLSAEDDKTAYQAGVAILFIIIGSIFAFGFYDKHIFSEFECTDGDGSVPHIFLMDGDDDCGDGSDEAESSSGEEQTEAEIFYDKRVDIRGGILICYGPILLGIFGGKLISKIQGARNDKVILTNSKIRDKFNSEYSEQIAKWTRLKADRRTIEKDLQKLNNKIKSYNGAKKGLNKIANHVRDLEASMEIEQNELDNMVKTKSSLEEQISSDWDKISDMIPYSNLVSSKNKSSAKHNDLDF